MLPHHPADEQQFPKDEPKQVLQRVSLRHKKRDGKTSYYWFVPPQVASVVTFLVPVEAGAEEVRVADAVV